MNCPICKKDFSSALSFFEAKDFLDFHLPRCRLAHTERLLRRAYMEISGLVYCSEECVDKELLGDIKEVVGEITCE